MRLPTPHKPAPVRTEQIILFRVSGQLFAVSSASVQEVRGVDSLAGSANRRWSLSCAARAPPC